MGAFYAEVEAGIAEMNAQIEEGIKRFYFELFSLIIMRSPVGNPENWKVNARKKSFNTKAGQINRSRRTINAAYNKYNAGVRKSLDKQVAAGKLPRKVASGIMSYRKLKTTKMVKKKAYTRPKNYVGGTFRANWQMSLDSQAMGIINAIDPSGQLAIESLKEVLGTLNLSTSKRAFFTNNLPYASAIEFGVPGKSPLYPVWSKQAPKGVVRRTMVDARAIFNRIFK